MARRGAPRERGTQDTSVCDSVISPAPARTCLLTRRGALTAGLLLGTCLSPLGSGLPWAVDVANETALRNAIFAANSGGDSSINVTANITLTQSLPMITSSVTVTGNGNTLDANNAGRAFFVQSGTAAISNLTINNAVAQGGAGTGGGGGGLGAGAAVFVNSSAAASMTNVTVGNASATGGAGGAPSVSGGGGGGGLGGTGGTGSQGGGGGGGYAGAGGTGGSGGAGGGGGGGGEFGTGGAALVGGGGGGGQQGGGGTGGVGGGGGGGGGLGANGGDRSGADPRAPARVPERRPGE